MNLPTPQPRTLAHTRSVSFLGYHREDGLWDIEAQLTDSKPMFFEVKGEKSWEPNDPIHQMIIRLTIDEELVVQDIWVDMKAVPHDECPNAMDPMKKMIGAKIGSGWRKEIEKNLGEIRGCAHLRELLFNMATAAIQTLTPKLRARKSDQAPAHLDKCSTWRTDSDLVHRLYPMFYKPKESSIPE